MRIHFGLLRCASWLVPAGQRAEWLAEWRSELWYVSRERTAFCLGAYRDALWLWRNSPRQPVHGPFHRESPVECLLFLAILAAASLFLASRWPVAREIVRPALHHTTGLVLISGHRHTAIEAPSIPFEQYQTWTKSASYRFEDLAFYQPVRSSIPVEGRHTDLSIARTSARLFDLLKIPISPGAPSLILSRAALRKYFRGDTRIVGRVVAVDGQSAVVAGILDDGLWRLPGRMDAWLIEDEEHWARRPLQSEGYVLAQLRTPGSHTHGLWHMLLPNPEGGYSDFDCVSLADRDDHPLFALVLLAVATWIVMRVNSSPRLGGLRTLRQWSFFSVKAVLLAPVAIFGSLDVAYLIGSILPVHIELPVVLAAWILAVRWVVRDQRQRCPVCLRLLINPVAIGQASQTFLGWYGTEFMCAKGHGMLHLPELPTSSSSAARWIRLDPSWSGLFQI